MSDLFSAQSAIVSRLAAQVSGATAYYGSQIAGANSNAVSLPCVIVAPGAAETPPTAHSDQGGPTWENHRWRVGVRVSMDTGAAVAARAEPLAGTLAYAVITALKGWTPTSGHNALRYVARDEMQYATEAGYAEVWLLFETTTAIA
jgi:hypothetical protein